MKTSIRLALCVSLLFALSACKVRQSEPKVSLKSLEMFKSATEDKALICRADAGKEFSELFDKYWVDLEKVDGKIIYGAAETRVKYKEALKETLATVPVGLLDSFFTSGGRLALIRDPKQSCLEQEKRNQGFFVNIVGSTGDVGGCVFSPVEGQSPWVWVGVRNELIKKESISKGSKEYNDLLVDISGVVDGMSLVASFFTSEVNDNPTLTDKGYLQFQKGGDADLQRSKMEIAFLLLNDYLEAKKLDDSLSLPGPYNDLLVNKDVINNNLEYNKRWQIFWENKDKEETQIFVNFVFAEVLSSHLCNDKTRNLLYGDGALFAGAGSWFNSKVKDELNRQFNDANIAANNAKSTNPQSLSLNSYPDPSKKSFGLAVGYRFPILGAVIRAPFAVGRYFVQNRPVRTFFARARPIRRTVWFFQNRRPVRTLISRIFPGTRCWRIRRWLCR